MLITLQELCRKYQIEDLAVLHIGAHEGEEREDYRECGAGKVVWVEANPTLAKGLVEKVASDPEAFAEEHVIEGAAFDVDGEELALNLTNITQSSSLLDLGTHRDSYPGIVVEDQVTVTARRIDVLAAEGPEIFRSLNFANLDIQGAELAALRGFGEYLAQFRWVYAEVNRREVYRGNGMIWDIDRLLLEAGFFRKETVFTPFGWGDAFYVKEEGASAFARSTYRARLRLQYLGWAIFDSPPVAFPLAFLGRVRRFLAR